MKLSLETLSEIQATLPAYKRNSVSPGIVHLGIGAFHRAHQAVYIDDLLASDPGWAIIGVSLRSPNTADALNPQSGLYTLITKGHGTPFLRVIGSVCKVMSAATERMQILSQMSAPQIRIVSLTVTEKGYCHDPSSGQLNLNHPDIQHDLAHPEMPHSAPGMITAALQARKNQGAGPFTVLSCDNLPENGQTTRRVVLGLAERQDPDLARWIKDQVTFPSTMVDRIVPATTAFERSLVREATGVEDAWPVVTEPFRQWVIEDNFCSGRPNFEDAGVVMTDDVQPFENMKLRLLNGSHSALAYKGLLTGHHTVADAMNHPEIAGFIRDLMQQEIASTLTMPQGINIDTYQEELLQRFRNPALNHQLSQIAEDGSQKLPQRILDTIRDRLETKQSIERLARVVAAWMQYISSKCGDTYTYNLQDPMAQTLRNCVEKDLREGSPTGQSLLNVREIFGKDLPASDVFRKELELSYHDLP